MKKSNKLTEIINKIKPMTEPGFRKLMNSELATLDRNEQDLDTIKRALQEETDSILDFYLDLLDLPTEYTADNLKLDKAQLFEADAEVMYLNRIFNEVTGYNSPQYYKYSHFSTRACKKIREIEIANGWDE